MNRLGIALLLAVAAVGASLRDLALHGESQHAPRQE